MTEFTWIPFYEEFASQLLQYENRQGELIAFLRELNAADLKALRLEDTGSQNARFEFTEIDPFTFLAAFNRGSSDEGTTQRRTQLLERVKTRFGIKAAVPADFAGVPLVDNRRSWFIPFQYERDPGDIPSLWKLARQAILGGRAAVESRVYERCLEIKTVGEAKLTMGLFWLRPSQFLPFDSRTVQWLQQRGIQGSAATWAAYCGLIEKVRTRFGGDFPGIALAAFQERDLPRQYWAGGITHGGEPQLERFLTGKLWELGWGRDSSNSRAQRQYERFDRIRVGDWFAIKGLGGRYHLKVHLIGEVTSIEAQSGLLRLEPLNLPHYRGRAPAGPGDGSWFEALARVTEPTAIQVIFGMSDSKNPGAEGPPLSRPSIPLNLILHGPPGTGKTWTMTNELRPQFQLGSAVTIPPGPDPEALTWPDAIAIALQASGPRKVRALLEDPLLQATYEAQGEHQPLEAIIRGNLQRHTSLFQFQPDGSWQLAQDLPATLKHRLEEWSHDAQEPVPETAKNEFFVTFHPSFTYEDFVEGLRPETGEAESAPVRYPLRAGIFKKACQQATRLAGFTGGLDAFCRLPREERGRLLAAAPPVVLFIDEINRGNLARILGELITLIEPDKRLGASQELMVQLPGSRQFFGVPSNLWIIGTMNTADRSVVALDTALRRRFAFRECPPRPDMLSGVAAEGIDLERLVSTINRRLLRLKDADHLIGHAFFMEMKEVPAKRTLEELRRIFREAILPLLREYFYEDLGRIGLVLGPRFVRREAAGDVFAQRFAHDQREDFADRPIYHLEAIDSLDAAAFRAIYE